MVSKENAKKDGSRSRPIQIGFSAESRELDQGLDLNDLLVRSPSSTFFFKLTERIRGEIELYPDDILVVDRSLSPQKNMVVIFSSDNGFLLGRCMLSHYQLLKASSSELMESSELDGLVIWGVVVGVVRDMKGGS